MSRAGGADPWRAPPKAAGARVTEKGEAGAEGGRKLLYVCACDRHTTQGAFSHSARTAPIITMIIQVTTLKTTHLRNHAQSIQLKTQKLKHLMLAMGPRDLNSAPYSPVHCSSHSMTSFQSSELTELPVVENSQLFAQRAHSARYAPTQGGD